MLKRMFQGIKYDLCKKKKKGDPEVKGTRLISVTGLLTGSEKTFSHSVGC